MKRAATVLGVIIILLQGGFPDAVWFVCGLAACVFLCFRWKKRPPAKVALLMAAINLIFIASALYHGLSYEALASVGKLMVACLLLIAFFNIDADAGESLFVAGMVVAAIGFATFCGVVHWEGAVASRRLQSVFQYSNAAGLYLGVAALYVRQDAKRTHYAVFIETAMLLTQSVGAILVYIAGWAVLILKNKESDFRQTLFNFAVSLFCAGAVYAMVYVLALPPLGLILPVVLVIFRKKIRYWAGIVSRGKAVLWAGCALCIAAVAALLALRGLTPFATYLERLIQIGDGLKAMVSAPLGIGPGAWQYSYQAYQSAPYTATILHCGYVVAGVNAGIAVLILIGIGLVYWLKHQKWEEKSICVLMILLHAVMDITFSFLAIIYILAMLLPETLPSAKPSPIAARSLLIIPLALCAVVFISAAVKNIATWSANSGFYAAAAERLESRVIRNDTEASLTQMSLYMQTGEYDMLDSAFESMPYPNASAYSLKAQSLIQRQDYQEAAKYAYGCAELSPYGEEGYSILSEAAAHLDGTLQSEYMEKADALKAEHRVNPLFILIQKLEGR